MTTFFCHMKEAERWASGAAGSGSEVRADAGSRRLHAYVRRLVFSAGWHDDWACGAALAEVTGCSQSRHVIVPSLQICTSWTVIGSLASGHCRCKPMAAVVASRVS